MESEFEFEFEFESEFNPEFVHPRQEAEMKNSLRSKFQSAFVVVLMLSMLFVLPVGAQDVLSQQKLDQLLAPIALYPDVLLGQILTASTYPLEVSQAEALVQANPNMHPEQISALSDNQQWDLSVKALLPFPSVLLMMSQNLAWTQQLGDAFLSQQQNVMDTVQSLRNKAIAAGHLISNSQQRIVTDNGYVSIDADNPDVYFVPYYNPAVVYGTWWWPDNRPIYWQPPPIYRSNGYSHEIAGGIAFGIGVGIIGSLFMDVRPDWHAHHMMVYGHGNRGQANIGNQWQHNPQHRQGVAYRNPDVRNHFLAPVVVPVGRENFRGRIPSMPSRTPLTLPSDHHPGLVRPARIDTPRGAPLPQRPVAVPTVQPQRQQMQHPQQHPQQQQQQQPSPAPISNARQFSHPLSPTGSRQEVQAHSMRGEQSRGGMPHEADDKRKK